MRILLTGHKGQLGRALLARLEVDHIIRGIDLPEEDITDRDAMVTLVRAFEPELIINSAAMTHVDGCARDPELAYRINGMGVQNLALSAAAIGAEMMQISTNEVFDGAAQAPYDEWAERQPINAYGRSKLAGEWYVQNLLTRFYVVRTAWLYAAEGKNFPHRILELAAERDRLQVVTDEVSNPTYVPDLVEALVKLIDTHAYGNYHLVNEGGASRFDFARALVGDSTTVEPITSAAFNRESTPPPYAPLANTAAAALNIRLRPWKEAVDAFIAEAGTRI